MTFSIPFQAFVIAGILAALVLFSYLYDGFVTRKLREGFSDNTWLFVVIGVTVTLCGAAIRDPEGAVWVLTCFVASGSFMAYRAIERGTEKKRNREQRAREAVLDVLREVRNNATTSIR